MSWGKVFKNYIEGINKEFVRWFQKDYEDVRDGKGHSGHPEVVTHLETIKQAIEQPDEVRCDKDHKKRYCYYAWYSGGHLYKNKHMKVVLGRRYGKLRVITAYFTAYFSNGEQTIWTKK